MGTVSNIAIANIKVIQLSGKQCLQLEEGFHKDWAAKDERLRKILRSALSRERATRLEGVVLGFNAIKKLQIRKAMNGETILSVRYMLFINMIIENCIYYENELDLFVLT